MLHCLPVCHSCLNLSRAGTACWVAHSWVWCWSMEPLTPSVLPTHTTHQLLNPEGHGSFGCSVNLPLGSRPANPHSTAVWCGNLLHSSPQPHTVVGVVATLHPMEYSLLQPRSAPEDTLTGVNPSGLSCLPCPSTCQCSAQLPQWQWTIRQTQLH